MLGPVSRCLGSARAQRQVGRYIGPGKLDAGVGNGALGQHVWFERVADTAVRDADQEWEAQQPLVVVRPLDRSEETTRHDDA